MAAKKALIRCLLGPGYAGSGEVGRFRLGAERVPVQVSGNPSFGRCLLFSTGFAGSTTDYGAVCKLFEPDHLVVRIAHPGSDRWAGLTALFRFAWERIWGAGLLQAAIAVRTWIHRLENYLRRHRQLLLVAQEITRRYSLKSVSLAGHSFGTDTALRGALSLDVESLYLFSPHPPGYLIPLEDYARLRAPTVWLVTGTRDFTRDGVTPADRLRVADVCDARVVNLPGVGHMDFAFAELGPAGWVEMLADTFRVGGAKFDD